MSHKGYAISTSHRQHQFSCSKQTSNVTRTRKLQVRNQSTTASIVDIMMAGTCKQIKFVTSCALIWLFASFLCNCTNAFGVYFKQIMTAVFLAYSKPQIQSHRTVFLTVVNILLFQMLLLHLCILFKNTFVHYTEVYTYTMCMLYGTSLQTPYFLKQN